jgi:hypothetical protein
LFNSQNAFAQRFFSLKKLRSNAGFTMVFANAPSQFHYTGILLIAIGCAVAPHAINSGSVVVEDEDGPISSQRAKQLIDTCATEFQSGSTDRQRTGYKIRHVSCLILLQSKRIREKLGDEADSTCKLDTLSSSGPDLRP